MRVRRAYAVDDRLALGVRANDISGSARTWIAVGEDGVFTDAEGTAVSFEARDTFAYRDMWVVVTNVRFRRRMACDDDFDTCGCVDSGRQSDTLSASAYARRGEDASDTEGEPTEVVYVFTTSLNLLLVLAAVPTLFICAILAFVCVSTKHAQVPRLVRAAPLRVGPHEVRGAPPSSPPLPSQPEGSAHNAVYAFRRSPGLYKAVPPGSATSSSGSAGGSGPAQRVSVTPGVT